MHCTYQTFEIQFQNSSRPTSWWVKIQLIYTFIHSQKWHNTGRSCCMMKLCLKSLYGLEQTHFFHHSQNVNYLQEFINQIDGNEIDVDSKIINIEYSWNISNTLIDRIRYIDFIRRTLKKLHFVLGAFFALDQSVQLPSIMECIKSFNCLFNIFWQYCSNTYISNSDGKCLPMYCVTVNVTSKICNRYLRLFSFPTIRRRLFLI